MKCENCIYFNVYYRRGIFGFWQESEGICGKSGNVERCYHVCEFFKKVPTQTATLETVESAITDVQELIKIYGEYDY